MVRFACFATSFFCSLSGQQVKRKVFLKPKAFYMPTIQTYKHNRKVICHITEFEGQFTTKTGKPSDNSCLSWIYDNLDSAKQTAEEYFNKYTSIFKLTK